MNYITTFFLFFVCFILQTTVFHFLKFFGIVPNITLILIIILSFLYKEFYGIVYGVIFGLLQDIFFSQIIGIAAFIYFTLGIIIYEIKKYIYKDSLFSPVIITFLGVTYYHLTYWLFMRLFNMNYNFLYILKSIYLGELVYDLIVAVFIYKFLISKIHSYGYYR